MLACNLTDALNVLDPERSLCTSDELRDWYVVRPLSPLQDLHILLTSTTTPQKILFTGHRGTGKTTELAKLAAGLSSRYLVVNYSVKNALNLFDLSYVDVVLSLGLELFRRAEDLGATLNPEVLAYVQNFTNQIVRQIDIGHSNGREVGADVAASLKIVSARLTVRLRDEDSTRESLRTEMGRRLADLLWAVEMLTKEMERVTGRRLLFIIEDLDKTDLKTAKDLFYGHATSLLAPPVSIIYTFPTALRHDNDFMQVEMNFPNVCILPNIKTHYRAGTDSPDEDGIQRLQSIITRRVDPDLFAEGALRSLAKLSSGIPRELVALARQACVEALKADTPRIGEDEVQRAAESKRRSYQVLLTPDQLALLARVRDTKRVDNSGDYRALLHNLSALEYRNKEVWHDVHPVVLPLLDR